ncbi:uncharacterized protein LOC102711881 [Oryza brachyantha]|uniref:uncharacterized protein LOC102711881 n=1 Tax=Oryza brachyantha TaxID=4533 RepID=UPI001ADB94A7|nr:uncharacterized protein LOC102711881 [Oryza brachyantha]
MCLYHYPLLESTSLRIHCQLDRRSEPMKKHAAASGCGVFSAGRIEKMMLYPLVASLEYIFCFGGWTVSCVALFHAIVSIYGAGMAEYLCSCPRMTAEEAAAMRAVEAYMLLCCAAQMTAAAVAMTATAGRRAARRASACAALTAGAATAWLWCLYLRFLPGLRCFRCFGVPRRVAVVSVGAGVATPVLFFVSVGLHAVIRGDENEWDD